MEEKIEFRKIRDFGEIINDTFVFLKQLGKPLLRTIVTICGIVILAQLLTSLLYGLKVSNMMSTGSQNIKDAIGWEYYTNLFLSLIGTTLLSLTTLSFIHVYKEKGNEAPTTQEVWVFVKFYFFKFLWVSFLLGIAMVLGFVLCFIPGIYLWPVLSLVPPIMLIENCSFSSAYHKCFKLIKGNWWTTFGVQIIMVFIVYAGVMLMALPTMIISGVNVFLQPGKMTGGLAVMTSILGVFDNFLITLPIIGIIFSYYSLSEQADGIGLMDRINNLGNANDPDALLPTEEY
jgi:hypothetical protein